MTTADQAPPARVLALGCGEPAGSAEILLLAAARAAGAGGAQVSLVRLSDLHVPTGPDASTRPDDTEWFWERLMECDALLVSAPVISRTVPARLKLLADTLLGPWADAAIIEHLLERQRAGRRIPPGWRVDERVLRPRVAGFIAVGGSLPARWKSLALPVMHTLTLSMQIAVVDQIVLHGAGTPRSIVLDAEALARASRLGQAVAGQMGRAFDDVVYQGEPGACPVCHLDVLVLRGQLVECATCGAHGELRVQDGAATPHFPAQGQLTSAITMAEKRDHFAQMRQTGSRLGEQRERIEQLAGPYTDPSELIGPR